MSNNLTYLLGIDSVCSKFIFCSGSAPLPLDKGHKVQTYIIYISALQSNAVHATSAKSRFQWSVIWPWLLVIYDPLKALLCCISLHTNSYQAISTHFHDIIPVQCSQMVEIIIIFTVQYSSKSKFWRRQYENTKLFTCSWIIRVWCSLFLGSSNLWLRISRSNILRRYYEARWVVLVYIQKQPASIVKS